MELMDSRNLRVGQQVRIRRPGRFNPALPDRREPDTYETGELFGIEPGIPKSFLVITPTGQRCIADGNIEAV